MSYLRPDADTILGNWTNESGSTPVFPSIDESAANDSDYARSGDLTSAPDTYKVRLSDSGTAQLPCTVRYRYLKQVDASQKVDLTVSLLQGAGTVTSWSHTDISTSAVTAAQVVAAGITDFSDLYLQFAASMQSASTGGGGLTGTPLGLLLAITQTSTTGGSSGSGEPLGMLLTITKS